MQNHKETIARIKFISNIKIGEKISLKNLILQEDGLYTQIFRTLNQDNRTKTLIFINDTVHKSFELLECYKKSSKLSEQIMCENLFIDLKASVKGIENLKTTYSTDLKFVCDLNCLLELIHAKILELSPHIIQSSPKIDCIPLSSDTSAISEPMPIFTLSSPQLSPQMPNKEKHNKKNKD